MAPELVLILTAFLVLIFDFSFLKANKKYLLWLTLAGLFSAIGILASDWGLVGTILGGRFATDTITAWFKFIFLLATLLTLSFSANSFESKTNPLTHRGEFLFLILLALIGMMFLISSRDLVSLYVSLELATLPLFGLTAWERSEKSGEAAFKYLAIGALGSGFLLYGMGLLYGITGQTDLNLLVQGLNPLLGANYSHLANETVSAGLFGNTATWLALGLIMTGLGFKLTLFPFHMWAPDAYDGAPTLVTGYLSVASKATGLALAFLFLYRVFPTQLTSMNTMIAVFATATMTLGNFAAIKQNNIKRLMAYSSISQAGYLFMGFLGQDQSSAQSMIYYMLVYVVTNLALFSILTLHIQESKDEDVRGLRGFSRTNPFFAFALMLALFGLAGIPPLSGFVGKFFLFSVAAKHGLYWLVIVAALNSTVSLYYYLRLVRQMYIEDPAPSAKAIPMQPLMVTGLVVATTASVLIGLIPQVYEGIGLAAQAWLALFIR